MNQPWMQQGWVEHTQALLNSYHRWVGQQLLPRTGNLREESRALFNAPFVVVSHGIEDDPILNYANLAALKLWQLDIQSLLQMPSRLTAEPMHRDERAQLLERTRRDGFVDDYRGIRISSTGERFLIERATVWNIVDGTGNRIGQAATFSDWKPLPGNVRQTPSASD